MQASQSIKLLHAEYSPSAQLSVCNSKFIYV